MSNIRSRPRTIRHVARLCWRVPCFPLLTLVLGVELFALAAFVARWWAWLPWLPCAGLVLVVWSGISGRMVTIWWAAAATIAAWAGALARLLVSIMRLVVRTVGWVSSP